MIRVRQQPRQIGITIAEAMPKTTYKELEVVPIPESIPELGIESGFLGTVDYVYEGGHRADVEVSREDGETIGFVTIDSWPEPHVVAYYAETEAPPGLPGENWPKTYRRRHSKGT